MKKKRRYSNTKRAVSLMLATLTVSQVAPLQVFAADATIKWDSVGGRIQGYFITEYGSGEPFRYIRNSSTSQPILKSSDLPGGELKLTQPSDWDIVKDRIQIENYNPYKLGEQVITMTYTSSDGGYASVEVNICVVKKPAVPQITDADISSVRSSQKIPTRDGEYLLNGFNSTSSHLGILLRLDIIRDKYVEDGKTYVDIGAYSYVMSSSSPFVYIVKAEVVPEYKAAPPVITPPTNVVLLPLNADADKIKENTNATAHDEKDGDITDNVVYSPVDTSETGPVIISAKVTNSDELSDDKDIPGAVIKIVDKIGKPVEEINPWDVVEGLDPSFEVEIIDNGDDTITVIVKDKNGNEESGDVELINISPPIITPPANVVLLPLNADADKIKENTNATAHDEQDGDISDKIVYSTVDTSNIGSVIIPASVANSGGLSDNEDIQGAVIKIVDKIGKPVDEIVPDDVVQGLDPSFEVEIIDNGDGTITVIVKDKNGNEESGKTELVNISHPIITPPSNVVLLPINANANDIKERTKATAHDKKDGDITDKIIYSPVNTSKIGSITIPASVTNSGGLSDSKNIPGAVIKIVDDTDKPIGEIKPEDVVEGLDPSFKVEIIDNEDGTITVIVKDKNGNEDIGDVDLVSGNFDNSLPVITAPDDVVLIPKGADRETVKNNIGATASDEEDGNLTDKIQYGQIDTSNTRQTNVELKVADSMGATAQKQVQASVVHIPDSIISGKKPSEISEDDIDIQGNHPDFKTTVTDNGDGTAHVKVEDKLGNYAEKDVAVINSGISTTGNNSLLESEMKNPTEIILVQTGAKAVDSDNTELEIEIRGLDMTKIGVSQKITLVAQGKSEKFTKDIHVHIVKIAKEVKTDSDGTTEQDGKSLTEGAESNFKFTPESKSKYKTGDKIKVTVEDSYGNKVEGYANVIGRKPTDNGNNTQRPVIIIDGNYVLLENNDQNPKKTILEQINAVGKNSDGSKADIKLSDPDMERVGETQNVKLSFTDSITGEHIEENVKAVIVNIIDELRVLEETTLKELEDWDTFELVEGFYDTMRLSHEVVNKSLIRVTVRDRYGNVVKGDVKVIYEINKTDENKASYPVIESKPSTIVKIGTL